MLLKVETGLSGTMFWEASEDHWLGEPMLLHGFNARMECKNLALPRGVALL